ncbi:MAG: flippase [Candidatus Magasanikbacteria bacterium]
MPYTVAQNTSFLTIASVLQKTVSFVYFTVIARLIGVENTGIYFFAIAFTSIFSVLADFGLASVLTRELSKFNDRSRYYAGTVFWTKIVFGLSAYICVAIAVNVLNYSPLTKQLIYLSGITMLFDNLHMVFYSIFRANRNLIFESAGIVGSQIITLIIGTVALFGGGNMYWLIIAYTFPAFINVLYSGYCARRFYGFRFSLAIDPIVLRSFLLMAYPFALAGIITRLYAFSDSLIMSKLLTAHELGYWSVPYKISFAFQFIPMALSASIYPAFSAFLVSEQNKISDLFAKSWRYLFTIVFPLSAGIFILAKPAIHLLYTVKYDASIPVLRVLIISLIFTFLSFVTGALLNAGNRQSTQTALMAMALSVNLISNLILIPRIGIMGAAYSVLLSNFLLWSIGYLIARKITHIDGKLICKYFLQTAVPALIMGFAVWFLNEKIYFLWTVPIGALIYFVLVFATGGMSLNFLKKKFADIRK